ncbi:glycosyltransferase family 4 protein [Marinobacter maritimus]|uniref:glycosyltransferase family 4 protein n=1 Tax=Marinobacter maritimus TaxID=277961 RepID=UPI00119E9C7C|nr:glycosyltransferase family 4 protein [Marinobacter maritimus]
MHFLFLMPVMGQPRYSKRIDMLKAESVVAEVAAFERDYHKGRMPSCPVTTLGRVRHGQYLKRVLVYIKSLIKIRKLAKRNEVIYSFGPDLSVLAYIATLGLPVKRVAEVADIRGLQTSDKLKGKLLRFFEKKLVQKLDLLVVTAPKFYSEYYQKWLGVDVNHVVIENKLEKEMLGNRSESREQPELNKSDIIKVGYFGLLRCNWTAETLYYLAKLYPDRFQVNIAGHWMLDSNLELQLRELGNVKYLGEYKSPDDLYDLYSSVDIIWVCYEPLSDKNYNLYWAKTNRFYESLFFNKPIIARSGSCDGDFVKEKNTGFCVSDISTEDAVSSLKDVINYRRVNQWRGAVSSLPASEFIYNDEAKLLLNSLKS